MVSTLFMVDTSSHPGTQLHRCVEKSAYVQMFIEHARLASRQLRQETN
jgi:hypothetical protein